jgi:hypothetical protein
MVDEAIEKRALAFENLHVCGRQIEPGSTVDLWKSLRLSALRRPFDLERVACDRIGVELAFDGERRHPLAPALPDVLPAVQEDLPERNLSLQGTLSAPRRTRPRPHPFRLLESSRPLVLISPERPAGMNQQDFQSATRLPIHQDTSA